MSGLAKIASLIFAIFTGIPVQDAIKECYLSLTKLQLFDAASRGNKIGQYCGVSVGGPTAVCNFYVKAIPSPTTGYNGWPRNVHDRGTGCVHDAQTSCFFTGRDYRKWPAAEMAQLCATQIGEVNAGEQLYHAIENDACGTYDLTTFIDYLLTL